MKIGICDGKTYQELGMDFNRLQEYGDIIYFDDSTSESVVDNLRECEIIIVNKVVFNQKNLSQLTNLKVLIEMATGYNNIDVDVCQKLGIKVYYAPDYSTESVAQHTFALLLAMCNYTSHYNEVVHSGKWSKNKTTCFLDQRLIELNNLTLGLIGYGKIGKEVGKIAHAFKMKVITYNKNRPTNDETKSVNLNELYQNSDIISLHCSLNKENKKMINTESINQMKSKVMIINTARGGLIDELALVEALKSGQVSQAALDVVSKEYIESDNPLLQLDNVILTSHVAWGSDQAINRLFELTIQNIDHYLNNSKTNRIV